MMSSTSIHLHPPLHTRSGYVSNTGNKPAGTGGLRMGMATARRVRLVVSSCCTAGRRPSEASPDPEEEDPRAARSRKYRDDMDKYAREYGAALRALGAGTGTTQDAMVQELEATLFRDEDDKFGTCVREISSNRCILCKEGRARALMVCVSAGMAIHLSTMIAANAHLRFNESTSGLSPPTVEQTIQTFVSTFVKTAEDACHRRLDRTSITSFLDALRGLAAVSHILFDDALAAVNHIEDGSSNYIPEYDVERLNHELNFNMQELKKNFTKASESEVCKLLHPTLTSAEKHISHFVTSMMYLRRKMVIRIEARNRRQSNDSSRDGPGS